jgi:hypothetical protein
MIAMRLDPEEYKQGFIWMSAQARQNIQLWIRASQAKGSPKMMR